MMSDSHPSSSSDSNRRRKRPFDVCGSFQFRRCLPYRDDEWPVTVQVFATIATCLSWSWWPTMVLCACFQLFWWHRRNKTVKNKHHHTTITGILSLVSLGVAIYADVTRFDSDRATTLGDTLALVSAVHWALTWICLFDFVECQKHHNHNNDYNHSNTDDYDALAFRGIKSWILQKLSPDSTQGMHSILPEEENHPYFDRDLKEWIYPGEEETVVHEPEALLEPKRSSGVLQRRRQTLEATRRCERFSGSATAKEQEAFVRRRTPSRLSLETKRLDRTWRWRRWWWAGALSPKQRRRSSNHSAKSF